MESRKQEQRSDKSKHYVNKREFNDMLVRFKEKNKHKVEYYVNDKGQKKIRFPEGRPKVPDEIAKVFFEMSQRTAYNWRFRNKYSFQEDMVANAVETCIRYIWNYDEHAMDPPNPFGYFNMYIFNAFKQTIKGEKKVFTDKVKYVQNLPVMEEFLNNHLLSDDTLDSEEVSAMKDNLQKYFEYDVGESSEPKKRKSNKENLEEFMTDDG